MEAKGAQMGGGSLVNKLVQAGLCLTKVKHEIPETGTKMLLSFYNTRPRAGLRPPGPRSDRREDTVLMGTLFTPRFAPSALSSKGIDCSSEDLQKMVKTSSWVSESLNRKFR